MKSTKLQFYSKFIESPAIRTVSNGSSIYSVMYAGSGNKITIKRKAAAVEDTDIGQHDDGTTRTNVGLFSPKKSSKGSKVILSKNYCGLTTVSHIIPQTWTKLMPELSL